MRHQSFKLASIAGVLFLSGFIILFPFFTSKAQKAKKDTIGEYRQNDTPRSKTITIRQGDLDKAMADINRVNLDSINIIVDAALASVNFDNIGKTIEASLASINSDSIARQVELAMKSVDMQKIQAEVDKAMTELRSSNWQKEMQEGLKEMQQSLKEVQKVNAVEIRKEMENAKKEMANAKLNMKDEMVKAKKDMEKAKAEIARLQTLMTQMKQDGLIKNGEDVKLQWKSGHLYINGKEQSEAVSGKYKALQDVQFNGNNDDDNEL
jgi:uncharacterized protein (DUF342 family)